MFNFLVTWYLHCIEPSLLIRTVFSKCLFFCFSSCKTSLGKCFHGRCFLHVICSLNFLQLWWCIHQSTQLKMSFFSLHIRAVPCSVVASRGSCCTQRSFVMMCLTWRVYNASYPVTKYCFTRQKENVCWGLLDYSVTQSESQSEGWSIVLHTDRKRHRNPTALVVRRSRTAQHIFLSAPVSSHPPIWAVPVSHSEVTRLAFILL